MLIKAMAIATAAVAMTAPATPPAPPSPPHVASCTTYSDLTPEQQARLDAKMKALDAKLARLNVRIQAQVDEAMKRADVQSRIAEQASRHAELAMAQFPPEKIDAMVARAMERARAGERAARAAEEAVARIQPRIDAMTRNLENMDINVDIETDDCAPEASPALCGDPRSAAAQDPHVLRRLSSRMTGG
jgi:hypothetical protein